MSEIIWALVLIDILTTLSLVLRHIILLSTVVVGIGSPIYLIFYTESGYFEDAFKNLLKVLKPVGIVLSVILLTYVLIPSKQTMQIALGLYATNQAVTYVADTDIAKQALSTLELKLKTIEQDLKQELETKDDGKQ